MSDPDLETIQASDIPLSAQPPKNQDDDVAAPLLGMGETKQAFQKQKQNNKVLWGIFGLLALLVVGVIFILPKFVSPADLQPTVVVVNPAGNSQNLEISPFQEAQILKQRSDAQDVLAALLEVQDTLEQKEVSLWGDAKFQEAINFAKTGDEAYSQQEFQSAEQNYQQGLDILQALEAQIPAFFSSYLQGGQSAILEGDALEAQQAFTIAMALNNESSEANNGYERAMVLGEVLALLDQGNIQQANQDYEAAVDLYQQALNIDSEHLTSRSALAQAKQAITDRDFANFMSQGYASLQSDFPELAENSFRQALSLKSNSPEALRALDQSSNQITYNTIADHLSAAQQHADEESWQSALSEYDLALSVDSNLVSAQEGKNYSNSRNNLDSFLQRTIEAPLRLADISVYEQALQVYNDARNITEQGPRLSAQLEAISAVLNSIKQEVNVSFNSDGLTNVTIARISNLGLFNTQTLSLTPGTYTAVGVREGYRDVRQEFTIPLNGSAPLITILCDETI